MTFLSVVSNAQFDNLITDCTNIEMPLFNKGQAIWVSYSNTGDTMFESRNAEIADLIVSSQLNEFIALELSRVSEVETIFTAFRNDVFSVWILLECFETTIRESIYDREKDIIDEFPMFDFDFYIIATENQDSEDIISGPVELVYKKSRPV